MGGPVKRAPEQEAGAEPSVGLVHDYLLVMRGAERTFAAMAECWPGAPIYTSVYSEEGTARRFARRQVKTSFLQHLHPRQSTFRRLLPLYPRAISSLPVGDHDLIVSSSSAFAHGIVSADGVTHVCYCHTPFRYAWHEREATLMGTARPLRPVLGPVLGRIRDWDRRVSQRVTSYIANSELVKQRIADCYGRDSVVVHPPVDVDRFTCGEPEDYFLIVSELARHKQIDVALSAADLAGVPVKVVGDGPELARLRAEFGKASFLGRVGDDALAKLYAGAQALIVPGIEEFGIAAVESQAAGRPVIALDAGGARETVIDDVTGVLVPAGGRDRFAEVLADVDFTSFSAQLIRRLAQRFSPRRFKLELLEAVASAHGSRVARPPAGPDRWPALVHTIGSDGTPQRPKVAH